jgi:hypothetical protein
MKKWLFRLMVASVLVALGFWGWRVFFPSAEKVIRKRLGELAKAASFSSNEGLLATALNASMLGGYFTPDVEVTVDVPGTEHTISGRDELLQAAVGARSTVSSLSIAFPDIKVVVAPGQDTAVVNLTARGKISRISGPTDSYLQELRLRMIKFKREWLINQIETVRTLSWNRREDRPSRVYSVGLRTREPQKRDGASVARLRPYCAKRLECVELAPAFDLNGPV